MRPPLAFRLSAKRFFFALAVSAAAWSSATAAPVTINFDNLPAGVVITNQFPEVKFSATFFSGGGGGPYGYDIYTRNNSGLGASAPNGIVSFDNTSPDPAHYYQGNVYLDFVRPVSNLRFKVLNSRDTSSICEVVVYQNGFYYNSYWIQGTARSSSPITVNLAFIPNVTRVLIRNVLNYSIDFEDHFPVYYDDFQFDTDTNLSITNPRVSGNLNGTTQKALLGGDVRLEASGSPTGGSYSWSITDPSYQHVSTSADGTAVLGRWRETGTYRATVTYTKDGIQTRASVDVDVIVPTLSSYTSNVTSDRIIGDADETCWGHGGTFGTVRYILGCPTPGEPERSFAGITFSATAQIPSAQYLSDPAQSGIKFVHLVSKLSKALVFGSTVCWTARQGTDANVQSGWQLDTQDPYDPRPTGLRRFSEGATLSTQSDDNPSVLMMTHDTGNPQFEYFDALTVDHHFEMYVVYFTGSNPSVPIFQRAIGFANPTNDPNLQVAYMPWRFAGGVYFDPPPQFFTPCSQYNAGHCLQSDTPTGHRSASSKACTSPTCMTTYSGNAASSFSYVQGVVA